MTTHEERQDARINLAIALREANRVAAIDSEVARALLNNLEELAETPEPPFVRIYCPRGMKVLTRVTTPDGRYVIPVTAVTWRMDAADGIAKCVLEVPLAFVDVEVREENVTLRLSDLKPEVVAGFPYRTTVDEYVAPTKRREPVDSETAQL